MTICEQIDRVIQPHTAESLAQQVGLATKPTSLAMVEWLLEQLRDYGNHAAVLSYSVLELYAHTVVDDTPREKGGNFETRWSDEDILRALVENELIKLEPEILEALEGSIDEEDTIDEADEVLNDEDMLDPKYWHLGLGELKSRYLRGILDILNKEICPIG